MKISRRADDTILYKFDGLGITVYDRKGRCIVASNGIITDFYSKKGRVWKTIAKTQNGYRIEKWRGSHWYYIDLTKISEDPLDYEISYPVSNVNSYEPLNWYGHNTISVLLPECVEAFNLVSLIEYGKNPGEAWVKNKPMKAELATCKMALEEKVAEAVSKRDPDSLLAASVGQYLSSYEDLIKYSCMHNYTYNFDEHHNKLRKLAEKHNLVLRHNFCGQYGSGREATRCWLEFPD